MAIDAATEGLTPDQPPRRLHPASPFMGLVVQARQFVAPLILLLLLRTGSGGGFGSLRFISAAAAVGVLAQFLGWRRFTYSVVGGHLVVDKGLFQRSHREIPLDRVHHVEEIAKLQHRVFKVVNLRIDSGGGESGAEIDLNAVSIREAARLRSLLDGRQATPGPVMRSARQGRAPLVRLSIGELVLAGVTNVPLAATLALVGSAGQLLDDLAEELLPRLVDRVPSTLVGVGGVIGLLAAIFVVFAGGAGVLTNYGFVLERDGHELRSQRGLLDTRRAVLDLRRLTVIRIEETLIRRLLGRCALRLQTVSGTRQSGVSTLTIPILRRSEIDRILAELMPMASPLPTLVRHPAAARRRLMIQQGAPAAVVAITAAWFWPPTGIIAGVLLIVLALCRAEVAYGALGHATCGDIVVSREGSLRRRTAVMSWPRSESTRLRSSPMQRWAGLASLNVDVPQGRSVTIADADPADLNRLRGLALTGPVKP